VDAGCVKPEQGKSNETILMPEREQQPLAETDAGKEPRAGDGVCYVFAIETRSGYERLRF
jgi:hypothetical protein